MLVNFCDTCLRTEVTCSTVSTEGYEVSNLINNSNKGFLAYSCIKPPVSIDFVFICNIQINYIIVYPQVGAQKSCGFQLSVKSCDTNAQPFTNISTTFLKKEDCGVIFYRADIPNSDIPGPPNFTKQCMKAFNIINYVTTMRLSILKTENSVPAVGKIEIWGKVSPKCSKDVSMNVMALWMNRFNNLPACSTSVSAENDSKKREERREQIPPNILNAPEDFIDPITCEIMTQPVILPSGKIIDQRTLEKHSYNEGIWGRNPSDPFTGVPFNDNRRPIPAFPLKTRIDKFLLDNSNTEEIKQLPRVLGSKSMQSCKTVEAISCLNTNSVNSLNNINKIKSTIPQVKRKLPNEESSSSNVKRTFHGHLLPVASMRTSSVKKKSFMSTGQNCVLRESVTQQEINKRNATIEEQLNANIKVTSVPTCKCCSEKVFYKLPCKHIICRKALLSLEKNQCTLCKLEFQTSDPQRYHYN